MQMWRGSNGPSKPGKPNTPIISTKHYHEHAKRSKALAAVRGDYDIHPACLHFFIMADFFSWLLLLFVFGNKLSFSTAGQRLPGYHAMAKQLSCQDGNGVHRTENWDSEQKRRKKKSIWIQNWLTTTRFMNKHHTILDATSDIIQTL